MKISPEVLEPTPDIRKLTLGQQRYYAIELKKAVREVVWRVKTAGNMDELAGIDIERARDMLNEILGE